VSKFELRKTTREDARELNALYHIHTGIERTNQQFAWEWFDGPYGPAPSWVVIDQDSRRIAAHHGVIPCPLWLNGRIIKAARTENSMVTPEYQGKVLYVAYESVILKKLMEDYDLIFTTTGKGTPGIVRKKLGYRSIGYWRTFTLHEPLAYLATRTAGDLAGRIVSKLTPKQSNRRGDLSLEHTVNTGRVAALWESSRNAYKFTPQRDAAYLKWRLLDNPFNQSKFAIVTKDGEDFGFIAWSERRTNLKAKDIIIEDIFCQNNDLQSYQALVYIFKNSLDFLPARITLRALLADNALCGAAALNTPRRLRHNEFRNGAELLVQTRAEVDLPISTMTMLISEGIN